MHIPDGFLDPLVCGATYAFIIPYTLYAFSKAKEIPREKRSLIPVLAAAVFAAQMLNWPIPGGTSLHFVGGALSGILLGPWGGYLVMFLVLLVQCLVFHDGGITTLGANLLNMAVIDVLVGYAVYKAAPPRHKTLAAFLGAWLGITLAGIAAGIELGVSAYTPYGLQITLPVMGGWHAALGVVEGAITALAYRYLEHRAPYLLGAKQARLG